MDTTRTTLLTGGAARDDERRELDRAADALLGERERRTDDGPSTGALLEGLTHGWPAYLTAAYVARVDHDALAASEAESMRRALAGAATMPQDALTSWWIAREVRGSAYAPSHACLDVDYGDDDTHADLWAGTFLPGGDARDLPRQDTRLRVREAERVGASTGYPLEHEHRLADDATVWLRHRGSPVISATRRSQGRVRAERARDRRDADDRAQRQDRMRDMLRTAGLCPHGEQRGACERCSADT